jgi:hypothetical protein
VGGAVREAREGGGGGRLVWYFRSLFQHQLSMSYDYGLLL